MCKLDLKAYDVELVRPFPSKDYELDDNWQSLVVVGQVDFSANQNISEATESSLNSLARQLSRKLSKEKGKWKVVSSPTLVVDTPSKEAKESGKASFHFFVHLGKVSPKEADRLWQEALTEETSLAIH